MADLSRQLKNFLERQDKSKIEPAKISNLKEKLQRIYEKSTREKFFPEEVVIKDYKNIEHFINGKWYNTPHGDVFIARSQFQISNRMGNRKLEEILQINDTWLAKLGNFKQIDAIDFNQTIFLDTETTGLSVGTGTISFIIGIGYLSEEKFFIDQYFIENFNKEAGMLSLLADFLKSYSTMITFNGKAFDIPILESRYILNMLDSPFKNLSHLDLLYPARQLWNLELENCKLSTIEEKILSIKRENDIPGEEVPRYYFRYLHTSDPKEIKPIFDHNRQDILSLVLTTIAIWQHFHNIDPHANTPSIKKSRAKILTKKGEIDRAIEEYKELISHNIPSFVKKEFLIKLGMLYKKKKIFREMESVFLKSIKIDDPFYLTPYIELAKYYEHKMKNYKEALKYIEMALERISNTKREDIQQLIKRLNRVKRKIAT
ncbi:MAG: ribonuclease H-like domain-containing protein [Candidatus Marinimicrobia bacterium]|nr:ribonuclease H-like domain-containing protein [Candidatus Neomarinimicrobiota bacterium]